MKNLKQYIAVLTEETFHITLMLYISFLVAEMIQNGIITHYFSYQALHAILGASGVSMIILKSFTGKSPKEIDSPPNDSLFSGELKKMLVRTLSVGGGLFIFFSLKMLGTAAFFIAVFSGLITFVVINTIAREQ